MCRRKGTTMYYPPYQNPYGDRLTQLKQQGADYAQYPQAYPQNCQQPTGTPAINWVSGEAGAKSWMVAAGNTVLLMDSENQTFYLKSADPSGMPLPLRIFDYKEREKQNPGKTEPEDLAQKYETISHKCDDLYQKYESLYEKLQDANFESEKLGTTQSGKAAVKNGKSTI